MSEYEHCWSIERSSLEEGNLAINPARSHHASPGSSPCPVHLWQSVVHDSSQKPDARTAGAGRQPFLSGLPGLWRCKRILGVGGGWKGLGEDAGGRIGGGGLCPSPAHTRDCWMSPRWGRQAPAQAGWPWHWAPGHWGTYVE